MRPELRGTTMDAPMVKSFTAAIACVGVSRLLTAIPLAIKLSASGSSGTLVAALLALEIALGLTLMWWAWSYQRVRSRYVIWLLLALIPYHLWLSLMYLGTAACPWGVDVCRTVHFVYVALVAALAVWLL